MKSKAAKIKVLPSTEELRRLLTNEDEDTI